MSDNIYLGNPNLKKSNVAIQWTQEQVQEYLKCKEDPLYFAVNYVKIISLDEGLVPFKMYDFQENLSEISMRIDLTSARCLDSRENQQLSFHTFSITHFSTIALLLVYLQTKHNCQRTIR